MLIAPLIGLVLAILSSLCVVVIALRLPDLESLFLTVAAVTVLCVAAVVKLAVGAHLILAFLILLLPTTGSLPL